MSQHTQLPKPRAPIVSAKRQPLASRSAYYDMLTLLDEATIDRASGSGFTHERLLSTSYARCVSRILAKDALPLLIISSRISRFGFAGTRFANTRRAPSKITEMCFVTSSARRLTYAGADSRGFIETSLAHADGIRASKTSPLVTPRSL